MISTFMVCFMVSLWAVTTLSYLVSWFTCLIKGQIDGFYFLGLVGLVTMGLYIYYEAMRKESK